MSYPKEYVNYLVHFHSDRDLFECHEILEEFWKQQGMKDKVWVNLIQVAVGLYHQRRGNDKGAVKILRSALQNLKSPTLDRLGLNGDALKNSLEQRIEQILAGDNFEDFNLPIADPLLHERCLEECRKRNVIWQSNSRFDDDQLIHRHTLRDRQDVINARLEKIRKKGKNPE
jgi:predicted metal-dependent hydrolase